MNWPGETIGSMFFRMNGLCSTTVSAVAKPARAATMAVVRTILMDKTQDVGKIVDMVECVPRMAGRKWSSYSILSKAYHIRYWITRAISYQAWGQAFWCNISGAPAF